MPESKIYYSFVWRRRHKHKCDQIVHNVIKIAVTKQFGQAEHDELCNFGDARGSETNSGVSSSNTIIWYYSSSFT